MHKRKKNASGSIVLLFDLKLTLDQDLMVQICK